MPEGNLSGLRQRPGTEGREDGKPCPDALALVFALLAVRTAPDRGPLQRARRHAQGFEVSRETGGWGFEGFKESTRDRAVKDMNKDCVASHEPQKDTDDTFSRNRR